MTVYWLDNQKYLALWAYNVTKYHYFSVFAPVVFMEHSQKKEMKLLLLSQDGRMPGY